MEELRTTHLQEKHDMNLQQRIEYEHRKNVLKRKHHDQVLKMDARHKKEIDTFNNIKKSLESSKNKPARKTFFEQFEEQVELKPKRSCTSLLAGRYGCLEEKNA